MNTYAKAMKFIKDATYEDKDILYDGIRDILKEDELNYPEDWQIKKLQRLADAKYQEFENIENYSSEKINDKPIGFVDLNQYKPLIMAALSESVNHQLLGSLGNEEAAKLCSRLQYEGYCIKNRITYEEMTDDDFERAYEEEVREQFGYNEYDL